MGCCASLFRKPQRQTQIIENGNSVENAAASADSATRPLTIPVVPVPVSNINILQPDTSIQISASQAQVQFNLPIPSNIVDDNLAPVIEARPVAFDADPFAIPSTSVKKLSVFATSSGGLGDIWMCSMTIDPATSLEVAVKTIRITDIRNEEAVQKAKKRLRREVAVWIRLIWKARQPRSTSLVHASPDTPYKAGSFCRTLNTLSENQIVLSPFSSA